MALQTTAPDVVAKNEQIRVLTNDIKTLTGDLKTLIGDIKSQNATAVLHLDTSDTQMGDLIEALGSVGLATGSNNVGSVNLAVNGATVGIGGTRVPVATAVSATPISKSTTITTGGTAQTLSAIKTDRVFLMIQNQDTAVDLWVNELGTANATNGSSMKIPPGALYEWPAGCVPITAISILSSKTGHVVFAREL